MAGRLYAAPSSRAGWRSSHPASRGFQSPSRTPWRSAPPALSASAPARGFRHPGGIGCCISCEYRIREGPVFPYRTREGPNTPGGRSILCPQGAMGNAPASDDLSTAGTRLCSASSGTIEAAIDERPFPGCGECQEWPSNTQWLVLSEDRQSVGIRPFVNAVAGCSQCLLRAEDRERIELPTLRVSCHRSDDRCASGQGFHRCHRMCASSRGTATPSPRAMRRAM